MTLKEIGEGETGGNLKALTKSTGTLLGRTANFSTFQDIKVKENSFSIQELLVKDVELDEKILD